MPAQVEVIDISGIADDPEMLARHALYQSHDPEGDYYDPAGGEA